MWSNHWATKANIQSMAILQYKILRKWKNNIRDNVWNIAYNFKQITILYHTNSCASCWACPLNVGILCHTACRKPCGLTCAHLPDHSTRKRPFSSWQSELSKINFVLGHSYGTIVIISQSINLVQQTNINDFIMIIHKNLKITCYWKVFSSPQSMRVVSPWWVWPFVTLHVTLLASLWLGSLEFFLESLNAIQNRIHFAVNDRNSLQTVQLILMR